MKETLRFLTALLICSLVIPGCAKREGVKVSAVEKERVIADLSRIDGPEGERRFSEIVERGKELFPIIIDALNHPVDDVAEAAAGVLGEMGERDALPHLVAFLKSGRNRRYAAAWALGEIGDPSSVFPLVEALEDKNSGVVKSATRAIIKLGKPVIPVLIDAIQSGSVRKKEAILIAFEDIGDIRAEEAVISMLESKNERVLRVRAARALAKCGTDRSVKPLIDSIREDDIDMKVAVAWSLGILEAKEAEPVLRELLEHEDTDVREWSARALENITGSRVFYRNARGEMVLPYSLYR